ncbi:hypothetical protein AX774_g6186, partial [Zancudomyces culisetae]
MMSGKNKEKLLKYADGGGKKVEARQESRFQDDIKDIVKETYSGVDRSTDVVHKRPKKMMSTFMIRQRLCKEEVLKKVQSDGAIKNKACNIGNGFDQKELNNKTRVREDEAEKDINRVTDKDKSINGNGNECQNVGKDEVQSKDDDEGTGEGRGEDKDEDKLEFWLQVPKNDPFESENYFKTQTKVFSKPTKKSILSMKEILRKTKSIIFSIDHDENKPKKPKAKIIDGKKYYANLDKRLISKPVTASTKNGELQEKIDMYELVGQGDGEFRSIPSVDAESITKKEYVDSVKGTGINDSLKKMFDKSKVAGAFNNYDSTFGTKLE